MYILKRGEGLSCHDKAWDLPSSNWEFWPTYLPNYMEEYLGEKEFLNVRFGVYRCMDDSFYAQPVDILSAPKCRDPMKIVSILPKQFRQYNSQNFSGIQEDRDMLYFKGTNWKLVGDKKWKPYTGDQDIASAPRVGEKTINGIVHEIRALTEGFVASPKP